MEAQNHQSITVSAMTHMCIHMQQEARLVSSHTTGELMSGE